MQYVFNEVNSLDKRCYETFGLSEDLLMEHAASSLASYIKQKFPLKNSVLIVCGMGNNGADGIALARLLYTSYDIRLYIPFELKSSMAKLQFERINKLGLQTVKTIEEADIVVDCLFGSGLNRPLDMTSQLIIDRMNVLPSFKLSCDIPSGLNVNGQVQDVAFEANCTITMGALKTSMFSDVAKEYVGEVQVANLGVERELYETISDTFLLENSDIQLPYRKKINTHKGSFGHLSVIVGDKCGAGILASKAAFSFGAGLVSVIAHKSLSVPEYIMQSHKLPKNTTALVMGMGLGNFEKSEIKAYLDTKVKKVIDADLFYESMLTEYLNEELVLTPHPKEFCSLLKLTNLANISVSELQDNRIKYVKLFCEKYPRVVLLLKGANVLIGSHNKLYINSLGSSVLSKGGSGDILAGLIASLLAQGYSSLNATISASLAHTIAANNYQGSSYSMNPDDLINEVKYL